MSDTSDIIPDAALAGPAGGASSDVIPDSALGGGYSPPQQAAAPAPETGLQHLQKAGALFLKNPWKFEAGMAENQLSGLTSGIGSVVDVLRGTDPNDPKAFAHQWAYQPRTESGKAQQGLAGEEGAAIGRGYDTAFGTGPEAQSIKKYGGQALQAAGTVYGAAGALEGGGSWLKSRGEAPAIEEGHPLTQAAKDSQANIEAHRQAAGEAGVPITPREISPAQRFLNNSAAEDLNLPKNSSVTSDLIDKGIEHNVAPAWKTVRATPDYELGPKYQAAIGKVDLSKIDPEWRPPIEGTMSGDQVADMSTQLRSVARGEFEDAENMNLTYAQRQAARKSAQAHYSAAKAVETGFREGAGDQAANAMDQARIYQAKAESWRGALDGAGNVIGTKIKKLMLADEPISGPMQRAASVVASDPEQFRSTRLSTPGPGVIRKTAAALAPAAAGAAGTLAAGPAGALPSVLAGEYLKGKILGK